MCGSGYPDYFNQNTLTAIKRIHFIFVRNYAHALQLNRYVQKQ